MTDARLRLFNQAKLVHMELDWLEQDLDRLVRNNNPNMHKEEIEQIEDSIVRCTEELIHIDERLRVLSDHPDRIRPSEETFETKLDDLGESPDH